MTIHVTFSSRPAGRILGFDLESRPSAFWFDGRPTAEITAFGWKWLDEPEVRSMVLLRDGRFQTDTGRKVSAASAYTAFVGHLCGAGLVFGHNIRQFDLPLVNAGLIRLKLPTLPELAHTTDTLRDIPRKRDISASLDSLAYLYELGSKKGMAVPEWEKANRLDPAGVDAAKERVTSDVLLQEKLRGRLLELGLLKPARVWKP